MASGEEALRAIQESRPPATDAFTYLTLIEQSLSSTSALAILPALNEILAQDVGLAKDIGWDLVDMLIGAGADSDEATAHAAEKCLETVARLGNPREVIIKVLEAMEKVTQHVAAAMASTGETDNPFDYPDETEEGGGGESAAAEGQVAAAASREPNPARAASQFVTLVSMLAVLHKRLVVRSPSRFLHATLQTVARTYPIHARSSPKATTAVIQLARSLSGLKRPPLPIRKSSLSTSLISFPDPSEADTAVDPEAEAEAEAEATTTDGGGGTTTGARRKGEVSGEEEELVKTLLRAFVTCVVEGFVNTCPVEWASRLLEFYRPEKIVPGKQTMLAAFKDEEDLHLRDAILGELVAIAADLGLCNMTPAQVRDACGAPFVKEPLNAELDSIKLSTGGFWCFTAYWLFASEIFDASYTYPDIHVFPNHATLLKRFLQDSPSESIAKSPGTVEALLVIGLWLESNAKIRQQHVAANYMEYHHRITLISVFHPSISVRNAATTFAGMILHHADEADRLKILEDLLENCMFSSLQACAVNWLREELIRASKASSKSRFASPEALEALQYALFPNMSSLAGPDTDAEAMWEYWAQNSPLLLQTANFAKFLFAPDSAFRIVVPSGMAGAVDTRYIEPLMKGAKLLSDAIANGEVGGGSDAAMINEVRMQTEIVMDRFKGLSL